MQINLFTEAHIIKLKKYFIYICQQNTIGGDIPGNIRFKLVPCLANLFLRLCATEGNDSLSSSGRPEVKLGPSMMSRLPHLSVCIIWYVGASKTPRSYNHRI